MGFGENHTSALSNARNISSYRRRVRASEESRERLSSPLHKLPVLVEGWLRQALGQSVGDVLSACTFEELDGAVPHHVPEEVNSHIHMT